MLLRRFLLRYVELIHLHKEVLIMIKIKIGDEKLSQPQITLLLKLKEGPSYTSELFNIMKYFGFSSRSSFYAALSELEEKGYVVRERGTVKLTRKGRELVNNLPKLIENRIHSLLHYIAFLMEKSGLIKEQFEFRSLVNEIDDAGELERYREFLISELEKVERKLNKWKKVEIE